MGLLDLPLSLQDVRLTGQVGARLGTCWRLPKGADVGPGVAWSRHVRLCPGLMSPAN